MYILSYTAALIRELKKESNRIKVDEAASEFNRTMDPEHFGVNLTYSRGSLPRAARDALAQRRPDADPDQLVPSSTNALLETIDAWIDAGYSKFLLRPATPPSNWTEELEQLASEVLSRQS